MLTNCDYAFVTSYENAYQLKTELNPMVAIGSFHYICLVLRADGTGVNLRMSHKDVNLKDYEGEELEKMKREIDEKVNEH